MFVMFLHWFGSVKRQNKNKRKVCSRIWKNERCELQSRNFWRHLFLKIWNSEGNLRIWCKSDIWKSRSKIEIEISKKLKKSQLFFLVSEISYRVIWWSFERHLGVIRGSLGSKCGWKVTKSQKWLFDMKEWSK